MAIYMKFGDIKGTVTTEGFKDWIELNSFQWGVGRGIGSPVGSDVEREASAPSVSEIVVTKNFDNSSNKLLADALAGEMATTVDIKFTVTVKDKTDEFLAYNLEKCGLSGYSVSSGGDRPSESLSLNFTKINVTYKARTSDGKAQPDSQGYDLALMKTV
jgi:type VI secretion system secreted protein Hcp